MDYYVLDENDCARLVEPKEYYAWKDSLPEDIQTGIGFRLARDEGDNVCVSTVYLGLDHSYDRGVPMLWETMVFYDGPEDQYAQRSARRSDALKVHQEFCKKYIKNN